MPKVTIEVPEELAEAVSKVAAELEAGLAAIRSGKPLDFAEWERRAAASASEVEREVVRRLLRGLDVDAAHVRVDGRLHARVGRYPATYRTQAGEVQVDAKAPVRLVDFWHLMEKLGAASLLLAGNKAPALRERWKLSLLNKPCPSAAATSRPPASPSSPCA